MIARTVKQAMRNSRLNKGSVQRQRVSRSRVCAYPGHMHGSGREREKKCDVSRSGRAVRAEDVPRRRAGGGGRAGRDWGRLPMADSASLPRGRRLGEPAGAFSVAGARPTLYFCVRVPPSTPPAGRWKSACLLVWAKNRVSVLAGPGAAAPCPPPPCAALLCVFVGVAALLRRRIVVAPCCLHSWRPALTAVRTCLRCSISARSPASRSCSAVL